MTSQQFNQNKLLLFFGWVFSTLAGVVFLLHQYTAFLETDVILENGHLKTEGNFVAVVVLLFLLIGLNVASWIVYKANASAAILPWLIMLSLTFASITIIAAGDGLIEYHFSIFVVVSIITMFHKKSLLLASASLFTAHHLVGYFFFPELICGTADYSFSLLLVHAFFLIMMTAAAMVIIHQMNIAAKQHKVSEQLYEQKMQAMLSDIQTAGRAVMCSAEELASETKSVKTASQAMEHVLVETKDNVQQTTGVVTELSVSANRLEHQMVDIQSITNTIAQQSTEATVLAENGYRSIDTVVEQNRRVEQSLNDLHAHISELFEDSKEVLAQVVDIEQISEQTKLLALNASIEAARAGTHGTGFSVVANEVQKLAATSKTATGEILQLINHIFDKVSQIQQSMEASLQQMASSTQVAVQTQYSFSHIVKNASEMECETVQISQILLSVVEQIKDVNYTYTNVLTGNEQLLTQSEKSLDASAEQMQNVRDLEELTIALNRIVEQLNDLVLHEEFTEMSKGRRQS